MQAAWMQDSWLVELRREPSRLRGAGFASPAPLAFERAQRAQAGCAHQQSRRGAPHPAIRSLRRPTKSRISWSCSISSAPLPSFVATGRHWLAARREEALVVSAIGQYGGPAAPNVQQDDEDGIALEDEDEQIDDSEGVPRGTQWVAARASGDRTLERIMETGKRGDVAGIIQAVEEHRGFLTDVHISAAMHVLGKFVQPHQRSRTPLMEKGLDFLADKFIHFTSTFRYRQLATFIYGCALAGYQNRAVLDLAAARAIASIHLFPPQNVSMLMWGCAKLNYRNAELLRAVASEVRTRVAKDFTPQGLANTAFGFSKLRHADAEMWQALAARTIEMSKQLNGQELSMLAFAFSAMQARRPTPSQTQLRDEQERQMRDETLFEAIAVAGRKMLHDSLTGFQMAVLSRAFGELGLRNEPLFATMASLAPARIGELSSDGLAQLARGYGLVGIRPRNLFKLISDRALEVLPHATPEEICHLAQAFSQVHVKDEALYRAITETVVGRQLQGFTARQVADLAMSFGRAAIPDRRLFRAIASWTIDNISRLSEDDIATIIRGFSATSVRDDALLRAVAENCLGERGFDRFQADTLADLLWAFANAGVRDESIFRAAAASMMPKVPQLSISGLCDTFTAFASMTAGLHTDEEAWALALYAALTEQLLTPGPRGTLRVEQLTHRQAATLVSSCRQAMYDDPRLLQALLRFALRTVRDLQASYLAQFVLAFASLQIDCAALLAHIPQGIKFFRSMHDFSNLVYGLVSVGRTDLLQYVIPNLEDTSRRFGGMTQEECSQLNLVFLAIRTEAPELLSLVPDQLRGRIEREHRHKLRSLEHMPRPSALHRAVSWILHNEMGAAFEEEYLVAGAYHVDIAFPEERIALEVDGPAHHLKVSQRFDGSTVLKQRLLRNLGWKVVHVSYVEWLRLESNEEKRVHLEGILRPVLYEDESARPTEEAYRAKPSQIRARSTHRPSELRSCPFCGNLFHQRGLGAHQRWCKVRSSRSDDTTTTSMS